MKQIRYIFLVLFLGLFSFSSAAQQSWVEGFILSDEGVPLEFVNVALEHTTTGTTSNEAGYFRLRVQPGPVVLLVSHLGYIARRITLNVAEAESRRVNITLEPTLTNLPDVEVRERQILSTDITRLDPKLVAVLPGPSSGVEGLVKTLPGVSSTTELSSQYSVRGGNFDENLVYVNGIEIYRPFLVRSGQQEGLSFLNSDLINAINFSAGGFDARFGDKMASVLDIEYRKPETFAGSFSMSLLEGSLHLEGLSRDKKTTFLFGLRHKSNQYLLGTLDTKGDYKPAFSDVQTLVTHQLNEKFELSFLGNFSNNRYLFQPVVQNTRFGTATEVRQLTVYFDGQEVDKFVTAMGAFSVKYTPLENMNLRWTTSIFQTDETENFDILGQYWLYRVETDMSQDGFGQPSGEALGVGSFLNHARNYLNAIVWNAEHQGEWRLENHLLRWGTKFQHEDIFDRLQEWTLIDSSGYSLPRPPDDQILLQDTISARIGLKTNRLSGFIQDTWDIDASHGRFAVTAGLRMNYWDFNHQFLLSPRATVLYKPLAIPRWAFRASAGYYHQPPFYRELRNFKGELNHDIEAQESIHFVLGSEYNFTAWNRPFKYTTEVYYKQLNNLIPYELDNVRIRYYAENLASGYATGIDMKVNGEFVPGVESWASLSLMKAAEEIEGAFYTDSLGNKTPAGYIPRPTDQRVNFSLFFQDFLPRNPTYKVQVGFIFGTGLPFGPPTYERQRDTLRMPAYRRVDIGFSKQLIGENTSFSERNPLRHFNNMWISAEVFNLLEMNNTISYLWIRDVENRLFAVPSYLTSRLINVKLVARF
ncbi:MAG: TonB-dependent receptor [Bacteroidales bacterium]|nr:TonB-dependent receptor [Bacteroidales bacterium]NLM92515.1 TonB-dependent receptor [Bacteroidales bacterium]